MKQTSPKERTVLLEILLAFTPFTDENFTMTFKPNQFFDNLEKCSKFSRISIIRSYNRALKEKIFGISNNRPVLSLKGRQLIQPFITSKLSNKGKFMVIFDIPEEIAGTRQRFRNLLRQFGFKQIQFSVWVSDMDYRKIIAETVWDMDISNYVKLYEACEI